MINELTVQKAKILCVDDEPLLLETYALCLENQPYDFKLAGSGQEGLTIARSFIPDLILSDVNMQGLDGLEFCKTIKADPILSTTLFIMVSGALTESADTVKGIDAGADDYLTKPFQPNELLAKIKAFMRIKRLQDQLLNSNNKFRAANDQLNQYKSELTQKTLDLKNEKQMLQNSLNQISLMVKERERINLEMESLYQNRESDFNNLITILSSIIESKRQYHQGHSQNVAQIASYIAKSLKLDPEKVRQIEISALLHEIGKISIPDELALKHPKHYTEQEKSFFMQHPVKGANLLSKYSGFTEISKNIRHFHEHFAGTGVPDGLKGVNIPLGSRIIAVANIFENLVYRAKDLSLEQALAIIEEHTGSKYDPNILHYLYRYLSDHPINEKARTKSVQLYELEPGMIISSGIHTVSGAKLLPKDTCLTQETIDRIIAYNKKEPIQGIIFVKE